MKILFSREWNKKDIRDIVNRHCYLNYYEMAFVVPAKWLKESVMEMFNVNDLDYWLQNEYTTDESEMIFEKALNDRQVVMVDFID